nr:enoyl-[acyl-carrier-protein] reductase FabK [uncultured Marvinbryantia sp.]
MRKTAITELLGIQYPILQGGMAWVAESTLAAAVSNAGGLGILAAANAPYEYVKEQIKKVKEQTDKPFGLNIMLLSPYAEDIAHLAAQERVPVVTTGAGNPGTYMTMWKNAGIRVIPVVASVALAKMMQRSGADAVIAEGCESGGHVGETTTMALVPQVADAVEIPVIAAGGIGDGRGFAAAMMLGAQGVQMGTRFLAAKECVIHQNYKDRVLRAKDIDTVVTGRSTGHPVRTLRNKMTREYLRMEKEGGSFDKLEALTIGGLRRAVLEGDADQGSMMSGQIAGLVKREQTCREILEEVMTQAEELLHG